ncbi:4'-phosphopantetheinyl transferase superfamily protein [Undibacterium sp. TS12]|uniref:4'-phosphopantetheinyl transferase family protein n=1 Tax=Undibacterium sp. TS12 TaxID=2908202 RepID=UPI001F4CB231|nr:4'-phosphopantetheinyl transferase superfamily protein [Undibacterium sp. TS12]MCH8621027.1 4'-phosphopantetheinyl transferase superfamily protein [Undibacterium sp. TS12]
MSDTTSSLTGDRATEIWTCSLAHLREYRDKLQNLLTAAEQARCQRYRQQDDRDRYMGGRALTKLAVAQFCRTPLADVSIAVQESGKPFVLLANEHLPVPGVSISHAGELVVVALGLVADIGVDVELLHHDVNIRELADVVCHPDEITDIYRPSDKTVTQRFYAYWVLKEAYLKATGDGLSANVRSVLFSIDADDQVNLIHGLANQADAGWEFSLRQHDDQHMMALATRTPARNRGSARVRQAPLLHDALPLLRAYCD